MGGVFNLGRGCMCQRATPPPTCLCLPFRQATHMVLSCFCCHLGSQNGQCNAPHSPFASFPLVPCVTIGSNLFGKTDNFWPPCSTAAEGELMGITRANHYHGWGDAYTAHVFLVWVVCLCGRTLVPSESFPGWGPGSHSGNHCHPVFFKKRRFRRGPTPSCPRTNAHLEWLSRAQ